MTPLKSINKQKFITIAENIEKQIDFLNKSSQSLEESHSLNVLFSFLQILIFKQKDIT